MAQITRKFNNTPLTEALRTIEQGQSEYTIAVLADGLADLRTYANVKNLSVPDAVRMVCKGLPVKVKVNGNKISVQSKGDMAQGRDVQNGKMIYGLVKDNITQEILYDVEVSIYSDTTLIAESKTDRNYRPTGNSEAGYWIATIPAQGGMLHFVFQKDGYEPTVQEYHVKPFKKIEQMRFAFNANIKRSKKDQILGAATVKATQIKFYHKGDTIVYNADAFQLAEGSMLDNLIKSMPGAELSDDGEITINGKHVDALLLNGEDFFKGKNKIMLENLPAYMVKNIKVYDRLDAMQQAMGRKDGDYVLDVNLKKQYSIGWIGNVEAGYGSEDRYLARLFALRFTDASRVGVYANLNNLNDTRKPGEDSNWTPETMPTGLLAQKAVGVDYLIKPKRTMKKFSGNAELKYTDADNYSESTVENYLSEGNTFMRNRTKSRRDNLAFSTSHRLEFNQSDGISGVKLIPSFDYSRYNRFGSNLSATFGSDPFSYADSRALLDSIYTMQGDNLRRIMLNRYIRETKYKGWKNTSSLYAFIMEKYAGVSYSVSGEIKYTAQKDETFSQYGIRYPNIPHDASVFQNVYTHDTPNRNLSYALTPNIHFLMNRYTNVNVGGEIGQKILRREYSRYNLDELSEWAENTEHILGQLPSETEYKFRAIDRQNSYDLHEYDNYQEAYVACQYQRVRKSEDAFNSRTTIYINMPVSRHHYRLDYTRGNVYSGITRRNAILLTPMMFFNRQWENRKREIEYLYYLEQTTPNMTNLIEVENTTDPLNIYTGNSKLRNISKHYMYLLYQANNPEKETNFSTRLTYNTTVNAIAYAYTYDRTTGIRRYRPQNVDGNYLLAADINYSRPLDKRKRLTLNTITHAKLDHGVDYISEDAAIAPMRSSVNTWWGTETIRLNYKLGKHSIGAKGYLGIGHVTSSREGFDAFTLCDFNYGLTTTVKLPCNFEISTDLTMYSHRGYATGSSNTNDLVWNARITKSLPKHGLVFMLDGFDILNQLSNISQVINSQGRTETYRNTLPRYIMAHIIYRLNKKPKKNGKEAEK
jgi:hypothetical protein